jgi:hypothetical protein
LINFKLKESSISKNSRIIFPIKKKFSEFYEVSKYGFIDSYGNPHFTSYFQFISEPQDDLILIKKENLYGYFNLEGVKVIDFKYQEATDFSLGYASVKINNKWGVINKTGKFVINPSYQEISKFSDGLAGVKIKNLWGIINTNGKILIKPQYKEVGLARDERIPVKKNILFGYIDYNNKLILPYKFKTPIPYKGGLLNNSLEEDNMCCTYTRIGKILNGCYHEQ